MYDHTKGGVDIVDLLSTNHSTRIKSKRWSLKALAFVLDTWRTNAKTILGDKNIKVTNFEFTKHSTGGNIPLRGNSVSILFVFEECIGIFVTFNIILGYIFLENFIEFHQAVQKI